MESKNDDKYNPKKSIEQPKSITCIFLNELYNTIKDETEEITLNNKLFLFYYNKSDLVFIDRSEIDAFWILIFDLYDKKQSISDFIKKISKLVNFDLNNMKSSIKYLTAYLKFNKKTFGDVLLEDNIYTLKTILKPDIILSLTENYNNYIIKQFQLIHSVILVPKCYCYLKSSLCMCNYKEKYSDDLENIDILFCYLLSKKSINNKISYYLSLLNYTLTKENYDFKLIM